MNKKPFNVYYILALAVCSLLVARDSIFSLAEGQMQYRSKLKTQLVRSPYNAMVSRERALEEGLRKGEFSSKDVVLFPQVSDEEAGFISTETSKEKEMEQEKLYRYYGIADSLYKQGKYEEAIEILKYILAKNPHDRYIKMYLDKITAESKSKDKQWQITSKSKARLLKDKRMKILLKEGINYYEQKRYGMALLKFSDVLAVDQDNGQAKMYVGKLKKYYGKEVHVENIVEKAEKISESGTNGMDDGGVDISNDKIRQAAEKMLDKKEPKHIAKDENIAKLLDQTELELTLEEIVKQKKEEEYKSARFTIGPGDYLGIKVRDHPELSGDSVIESSGEIVLPAVNDWVKVEGLTVKEAATKIENVLKKYVSHPFVILSVEEYRSKLFYVLTELGCQPYPITRANFTLRDALFSANWGADRALGRVIVMKPNALHPMVQKVNAFDIIYRGHLINNIKIEDGDVIYVPMTVAAKVSQTISDVLRPFGAVKAARDEWINQKGDLWSYSELPKVHYHDRGSIWSDEALPQSVWYVPVMQQ